MLWWLFGCLATCLTAASNKRCHENPDFYFLKNLGRNIWTFKNEFTFKSEQVLCTCYQVDHHWRSAPGCIFENPKTKNRIKGNIPEKNGSTFFSAGFNRLTENRFWNLAFILLKTMRGFPFICSLVAHFLLRDWFYSQIRLFEMEYHSYSYWINWKYIHQKKRWQTWERKNKNCRPKPRVFIVDQLEIYPSEKAMADLVAKKQKCRPNQVHAAFGVSSTNIHQKK